MCHVTANDHWFLEQDLHFLFLTFIQIEVDLNIEKHVKENYKDGNQGYSCYIAQLFHIERILYGYQDTHYKNVQHQFMLYSVKQFYVVIIEQDLELTCGILVVTDGLKATTDNDQKIDQVDVEI